MIDTRRLIEILDYLVAKNVIHSGQRQDVINRGGEQARHILLDKRADMRRLMGRQRVSYKLSAIELIASFRFKHRQDEEQAVDEELITRMVAEKLGIPFVILDPLKLDYQTVTATFGGPFAERHQVIAVEDTDDHITVAVADPWDRELLGSIARVKGKPVHPVLATKSQIIRVIVEFHGFRRSMRAAEAEFGGSVAPDLSNLEQLYALEGVSNVDGTDQPVVRAVWFLIHYALEHRASDIHIEPKREESWVRMRIDGVLHRIHRLPRVVHGAVLSRLKMLARLDIAERRRPQDGRFKTRYQQYEVELRVSTVPTAFGEKVVIRVFDPGILLQDIEKLGFFPREHDQFRRMIESHTGLVLVVGPTGSGKTTTLYSSLHHLCSPRVNVITLEDPIEMIHEDFNQIAMQPRIGVTFGSALKNVLRQDPDIIMVGEIRDEETATNVIQSALTGHMVLSTIHSGEAASAVGRMMDLGVLPFLISSVLVGVIAQRLVRRVCPHCAEDVELTEEQAFALRIPGARGRRLKIKQGRGCVKCRYTGYLGRTGLFEVMPITPRIQRLINERASTQEIKREALNDGMLTLREYGIKKIANGLTTIEEVLATTDDARLY
jgi:general secretion pathway protein E